MLSEWLGILVKKTEKLKLLTSNFGELPQDKKIVVAEAKAEASTSTREKVKTISNTWQCIDLCVEESLLVSPMIASLKKSYDHLPPKLKLCLLCLSVFPENFVIKKRPLVYWWMAEGFLTDEDDGEGSFMELICKEFIQPCYHEGGNMTGKVGACRVQPWIRRMLVSIALEAQFFEFYGGREKTDRIWVRLCLCNNEEDVYDAITRKIEIWLGDDIFNRLEIITERLKWERAKSIHYAHKLDLVIYMEASNMSRDPEVHGEQQTSTFTSATLDDLYNSCKYILDILIVMVDDERKVTMLGHLKRLCQWIIDNRKRYYDEFGVWSDNPLLKKGSLGKEKEMSDLQEKLQGTYVRIKHQLEASRSCLNDCMHYDDELYNRRKNCELLQKHEDMFSQYHDLTLHFPSPMKKRDDGEYYHEGGKVLGIINVNQDNPDLEEKWFGRLKNLQTFHLGRWQDSRPIHHIDVRNPGFLKALFQVAKHLKYLSLRGVSGITELPSTISECCNLQTLDLKACYDLENLPPQIVLLAKLTHFDVSECYLLSQNDRLWSSVLEKLKLLRTLKGVKISKRFKTRSAEKLRKLGVIFTASMVFTLPTHCFHHLRVLTLTWRTTSLQGEKLEVTFPAQLLQNLSKLDLRCYPEKDWPVWLHQLPALETLYITGGKILSFPTDLTNFKFDKLQVLRLKYLTNTMLDFPRSKQTSFPSLKYYAGLNFTDM
nr:Disease resistance RPP13-like protein 4 [Ipomoea batatas]